MKTTKLILVAAIIAIASLGYSQVESSPTLSEETSSICKFATKIHLKTALQYPALVRAMYAQLDPRFLLNDQRIYTVRVNLRGTIFYISGPAAHWKRFFSVSPNEVPPEG